MPGACCWITSPHTSRNVPVDDKTVAGNTITGPGSRLVPGALDPNPGALGVYPGALGVYPGALGVYPGALGLYPVANSSTARRYLARTPLQVHSHLGFTIPV